MNQFILPYAYRIPDTVTYLLSKLEMEDKIKDLPISLPSKVINSDLNIEPKENKKRKKMSSGLFSQDFEMMDIESEP